MKISCFLLGTSLSVRGSKVDDRKMTFGLSGWTALSPV